MNSKREEVCEERGVRKTNERSNRQRSRITDQLREIFGARNDRGPSRNEDEVRYRRVRNVPSFGQDPLARERDQAPLLPYTGVGL